MTPDAAIFITLMVIIGWLIFLAVSLYVLIGFARIWHYSKKQTILLEDMRSFMISVAARRQK